MEHDLPPHAKQVFEGTIFTVWQWEQELYDGSTATFEALTRPDSVQVIGVLPDKKILLVWDKQPHRKAVLTPAGGRIEEGENPKKAAVREFEEETGHMIGELVPWFAYTPSEKVKSTVHFFIARNISPNGMENQDAGEKIECKTYTFEEFLELGNSPDLRDWQLRIILLEARLDPKKKETLKQLLYG